MNNQIDENAVMEVIQNYINGTYSADIALLKSVFHEKAVMNGYIGSSLLMSDPSPFIDDIASSPSMKAKNDPYNVEIISISREGNVASAIVRETGFRGDTTLVSFFHLINTDGELRIISKLFTTV